MTKAFQQGWLDSLCGVYSIVNAYSILHNSSDNESQEVFNEIITYLSKKKSLRKMIIDGVGHDWMVRIMNDVIGDRIPIKDGNKKNIATLNEWWQMAMEFMAEEEKRTIILSLYGRFEHYTVASAITEKSISFIDSSPQPTGLIRKGACKIKGYKKSDKYIIFPAQCWFLGM